MEIVMTTTQPPVTPADVTALNQRLRSQLMWFTKNKAFMPILGIMNAMPHTSSTEVRTACASPKGFFYGVSFCKPLPNRQLRGLIMHESLHYILGHLTNYTVTVKKDSRRANRAMDYVVNAWISNFVAQHRLGSDVALPDGALLDEKYYGLPYLDVYNMLEDEDSGGGKGDGGDAGDHGTLDDHVQGEDAGLTPEESKALGEAIQRALEQAEALGRMHGAGTSDLSNHHTPRVDWRKALRDFMQSVTRGKDKTTWRKFNRRFAPLGVYLPSHYSVAVANGVIAVDTSGSVTGDVLSAFMSEVGALANQCKPSFIDIVYWGSTVVGCDRYAAQQYSSLAGISSVPNGGGTEPQVIMPYVKQHNLDPKWIVVLTDGYFNNPTNFGVPTLWVVYKNPRWVAPFGKTVHI